MESKSTGASTASQLDHSERLIVVHRRPPLQLTSELLHTDEPLEDDHKPVPASCPPSATQQPQQQQQQQQQLNGDNGEQRDDDVTPSTHEHHQSPQPSTLTSSTQITPLQQQQQQQQQKQLNDGDSEQQGKSSTCGQPPLLSTESETTIRDQPAPADSVEHHHLESQVSAPEAATHSCRTDTAAHQPRCSGNPRYSGDLIVELPVYSGDCCLQYPAAVDENIVPEEFTDFGITMSSDDYGQLMRPITSCFYVRCHCCFSSACVLLFVTSVVTSYIIGWSLCVACSSPAIAGRHCAFIEAVIAAMVAVCVWSVAIAFCVFQWRRFKIILQKVNNRTRDNDMLVACKDYGRCSRCLCNRFTIIFFYYQWQHCESRLQQFLENDFNYVHSRSLQQQQQQLMSDGDTQLLVDSDDDDQLLLSSAAAATTATTGASSDDELECRTHVTRRFTQNEASELMVKYSVEYGKLLVEERLLTPVEQRHTRHLECLCQFVQRKLAQSNN